MGKILIRDLEVFYHIGVGDEERARPQRLLLTVELACDLSAAGRSDALQDTIDYWAVSRELLSFGEGRSWRLIEKLAADLAEHIIARYPIDEVTVDVKKFVIPEARYVSVSLTRTNHP